MKYVKIAQTTDLSNGKKTKITFENREILLVNIEGSFYAVDNNNALYR